MSLLLKFIFIKYTSSLKFVKQFKMIQLSHCVYYNFPKLILHQVADFPIKRTKKKGKIWKKVSMISSSVCFFIEII